MAGISVGKLFMGAIFPGLLLSTLYSSYIALRSAIQPKLAPVATAKEMAVPFIRRTFVLATALVPAALIILSVLGAIFMGLAPPTEAAAVGAVASTLLAVAYRKFSWQVLRETAQRTLWVSSMIYLLGATAFAFTAVFVGAGGSKTVESMILAAPFGRWGAFFVMMFIIFILGFFVDWPAILFIMVPIFVPIVSTLGFNPLWFGIMVMLNLQLAYMTPPFALPIFYVRGSAPPELGITMADIIRGVIPFAVLIVIGMGLCVLFPQIILWLPSMMIK